MMTTSTRRSRSTRIGVSFHRFAMLFTVAVVAFIGTIAPAVLAADPVAISITSVLSDPGVTVAPGTMVTWTNNDDERHRIRSISGPEEFDSGNIETGESFSFFFETAGTYQYNDDRNKDDANYFGAIVVTAPDEGDPGGGDPGDPGGGDPAPPPPASGGSTVNIIDRSFQPPALTVADGATVVWNNLDGSHTVTANDGSFDSGIFDSGTYSRTFPSTGTYSYFCTLHTEMVGTITVTGGDGSTPPPPVTTTTTAAPAPAPPAASPTSGDVTIFDNGFTPTSKTVTAGSTVTWSNTGATPHTVTDINGGFDSGFVMPGDPYNRTFNSAGAFSYFCTIHPEMVGTITVTATDGSAPPPAASPAPAPAQPPTSGGSTPAPAGAVKIFDNGFTPRSKTITAGSTVTWANTGAIPHTVTDKTGGFDSGFLMAGQTYSKTFNTPDTYSYFCTIHPGMTGTITVTGTATGQADIEAIGSGDGAALAGSTDPNASDPKVPSVVSGGPTDAPDEPVPAEIIDFGYDPRSLSIGRGTTVIWENVGAQPHTVTDRDGAYDSGVLLSGDTYERTYDVVGTFEYFCTIHPDMVAKVTVGEATSDDGGATAVQASGVVPALPPSRPSPEAGALIGLLFVVAAGLTGAMTLFTRKLLTDISPDG